MPTFFSTPRSICLPWNLLTLIRVRVDGARRDHGGASDPLPHGYARDCAWFPAPAENGLDGNADDEHRHENARRARLQFPCFCHTAMLFEPLEVPCKMWCHDL